MKSGLLFSALLATVFGSAIGAEQGDAPTRLNNFIAELLAKREQRGAGLDGSDVGTLFSLCVDAGGDFNECMSIFAPLVAVPLQGVDQPAQPSAESIPSHYEEEGTAEPQVQLQPEPSSVEAEDPSGDPEMEAFLYAQEPVIHVVDPKIFTPQVDLLRAWDLCKDTVTKVATESDPQKIANDAMAEFKRVLASEEARQAAQMGLHFGRGVLAEGVHFVCGVLQAVSPSINSPTVPTECKGLQPAGFTLGAFGPLAARLNPFSMPGVTTPQASSNTVPVPPPSSGAAENQDLFVVENSGRRVLVSKSLGTVQQIPDQLSIPSGIRTIARSAVARIVPDGNGYLVLLRDGSFEHVPAAVAVLFE